MEQLRDDKMLKFGPETLNAVRKELNLEKSTRINEAIDILDNWVKMQPHFTKKDFSRDYLERTLITCKGLVERAKDRLDKLCTFKTLLPEFFLVPNPKKEFAGLQTIISTAHLPKLTPQYYRVYISKVVSDANFDSTKLFSFYKYLTMLSEYFKRAEYCSGFVVILDYSDINIMNIVTKINPTELRQIVTLMTEGYGLRIKGIHVITPSKMVDTLVALLKQVFSAKLANRIHIHKNAETLDEYVPKDMLPIEYGGKEKSVKELQSEWLDAICSRNFLDYYEDHIHAKTNESCRQTDKFNENYIGMPGSFRTLSVD